MKLFKLVLLIAACVCFISSPSFAEHSTCEKKIHEAEQRAELAERKATEAEKRAELAEQRIKKYEPDQPPADKEKIQKKRRVGDDGFRI